MVANPYASMLEGNEVLQREQEVVASYVINLGETRDEIGDDFKQHNAGLSVPGCWMFVSSSNGAALLFEDRTKCPFRPTLRFPQLGLPSPVPDPRGTKAHHPGNHASSVNNLAH